LQRSGRELEHGFGGLGEDSRPRMAEEQVTEAERAGRCAFLTSLSYFLSPRAWLIFITAGELMRAFVGILCMSALAGCVQEDTFGRYPERRGYYVRDGFDARRRMDAAMER